MRKLFLLMSCALTLAACASNPEKSASAPDETAALTVTSKPSDMVNDGRNIAEAQCAACHAVGVYGESPNPKAPTFRTLLSNYPPDLLEDNLMSGIQVAHPMPDFQFNPTGVDSLLEYLKSIQEPS